MGGIVSEIKKYIARRVYHTSSGEIIEIIISYPENGSLDWFCYHSIKWGDWPASKKRAFGIDALDALLRSIKMIEVQLTAKAEMIGVTISWDGNPDIGLSP